MKLVCTVYLLDKNSRVDDSNYKDASLFFLPEVLTLVLGPSSVLFFRAFPFLVFQPPPFWTPVSYSNYLTKAFSKLFSSFSLHLLYTYRCHFQDDSSMWCLAGCIHQFANYLGSKLFAMFITRPTCVKKLVPAFNFHFYRCIVYVCSFIHFFIPFVLSLLISFIPFNWEKNPLRISFWLAILSRII